MNGCNKARAYFSVICPSCNRMMVEYRLERTVKCLVSGCELYNIEFHAPQIELVPVVSQEDIVSTAWTRWLEHVKETSRKAEWMWRFFEDGDIRIECFISDIVHFEGLRSGCGSWRVTGPIEQAINLAIEKSNRTN